MRDGGRANREELHEILREDEIQGPVERHADLLFKTREFAEIDGPP